MVEKEPKEQMEANIEDDREEPETDESLICRYYRNEFPEEHDLVVVKILNVHETGAYVSLLEYNEIEGMIPFTEVTRRRVNSVSRLVRVGKIEIMMVLRVDPEKGYIDLSKKKVHHEESEKKINFYKKAKFVHSIMKQTASHLGVPLEDIYNKFGWPIYDKFEHAYEAFRLAMNEPDMVFEGLDISAEEREALLLCISKRMMPSAIKIRTEFELTCFTYDGIDTIKKALLAAKQETNCEDFDIKYKLIAPPIYNAELLTLDR
jgi:translation initiation factor 2 subunit 1